jgi:hypothetical protein
VTQKVRQHKLRSKDNRANSARRVSDPDLKRFKASLSGVISAVKKSRHSPTMMCQISERLGLGTQKVYLKRCCEEPRPACP